jgi:hypothetical protein
MPQPAVEMSYQEGGAHVVYDCRSIGHFMAVGVGERLYDGQLHSHSARRCHHRRAGQSHSGAEARLERKRADEKEVCTINDSGVGIYAFRMFRH